MRASVTMRHFVTGGAGFIGSHLIDRLVGERQEVTVYDNLSSGRLEFISHHIGRGGFRFIRGDLLDPAALKEAVPGHDIVHHLAANPDIRLGTTAPETDLRQGVLATFNLLEAMREAGVRRIAFSSSSVVYGEAEVIPTAEDYGPLKPISIYGASKLGAEGLITAYCHTFDMQSWIFRFANVVGERSTHGVIFDFMKKLRANPKELEVLGDGSQRKAYLLVQDCVDAMLHVISRARDDVNIYNLGCEDQVRVSRIAEIVLEEMGLKGARIRYTGGDRGWRGDVREMLLSIERLKAIGWRPRTTSEEAVRAAARAAVAQIR